MKPKIVLGFIGTIGSGKDFAAGHLIKSHGFQSISMGDLVREAATNKGIELNRKNLQKISKSFTDKHGMHYWADEVSKRILKLNWEKVIINGVRRVQELEVYRKHFSPNFKLVFVDADSKVRFERLKSRARVGFPDTWEKFVEHEKGESKLYGTFEESIKLADYNIKNESSADALYKQLDSVLRELKLL